MNRLTALLFLLCCFCYSALAVDKPRVIVLTDITNEPDDEQSMVRYLCYANEFDTEALVATTSCWLRDKTAPDQIEKRITAYGEVRPQLMKHAVDWPAAQQLHDVVRTGVSKFGMEGVGEGNDSSGSERIIEVVDSGDPRPVYVSIWGGANCLAQALWKVQQNRSKDEIAKFVAKLRVYTISDQDDAGPWMRKTFPKLFYIVSPGYEQNDGGGYHYATWTGISGDKFHGRFKGGDFQLVDNPWLDENIRKNHGRLGALHPRTKYLMEGDTPSFFWLIPNGLNVPENPSFGGWGGRYERYAPPKQTWHYQQEPVIWGDAFDEVTGKDGMQYRSNQATIWRWRKAYQHDFAARIDWSNSPRFEQANHHPQIVLRIGGRYQSPANNGASRLDFLDPIEVDVKSGETIALDALQSTDPDSDELTFRWWQYQEAGSYDGRIKIEEAGAPIAKLVVPEVRSHKTMHIILEVEDSGKPSLTSYRRIILNVLPAAPGKDQRYRVFVTTDISDGEGDPDDRQSLCHLLYYADELDIRGIVPDRFSEIGNRACEIALDRYEQDFNLPWTKYRQLGYPTADEIRQRVFTDKDEATQELIDEAMSADERPLYVLAWGNLRFVTGALARQPKLAEKIRLLTIGTHLKAKADKGDGEIRNWNSPGRQEIFDKYPGLWWLESDWTYNGMFVGPEAVATKDALAKNGGRLGQHIKEVMETVDWADYFRAGDTPTVLYLLDPDHDANDPSAASWAGRFVKPFPDERPHYWTGVDGGETWNYRDPKRTWQSSDAVYKARVGTLLARRAEMYRALQSKVRDLYGARYDYELKKALAAEPE